MERIHSHSELQPLLQRSKQTGKAHRTNLFASPQQLQAWCSDTDVRAGIVGASLFVLRPDHDFHRLYFSAPSLDDLGADLARLSFLREHPVVLDLVGMPTIIADQQSVFAAARFRLLAALSRMSRAVSGPPPLPIATDSRLRWAGAGDASEVWQRLEANFDSRAEQLPTLPEVQAAITGQRILVAQGPDRLVGLLWFESHGLTSLLRFWLVEDAFRGCGLGSSLMRCYLEHSPQARRYLLWVLDSNRHAIDCYLRYGFQREQLVDLVLTNDPASA